MAGGGLATLRLCDLLRALFLLLVLPYTPQPTAPQHTAPHRLAPGERFHPRLILANSSGAGESMLIDAEAIHRYRRDGYLIVPELFSAAEVKVLLDELESDFIGGIAHNTADGSGRSSRFAIWHELKEDVWGAASISPRIVESLRTLTGEEISFFHGKVIFKEPGSSAAWEWHQDYGYWYHSFIFPRMASAWVALDHARISNGCLQVLRGSHRLGRLEHGQMGDQQGIQPARLQEVMPLFERVDCEIPPGSVIFFDSQLIHGSNPNTTSGFRRSFIMCYTAQDNLEIIPGKAPYRRPLCPVGAEDGLVRAGRNRTAAS